VSATQYAALIPGWRQSCAPAVILLIYPTRSGRLYRPASRRRRPRTTDPCRVRCDPLLAPDRLPIADAGHDLPWTARAEQRRCWPPTYSSQQQIVESHADPDFCPGRLRRRFRAEIASEPLVGAGRFSDSACPFATEALSDGIGSGVLSSVADGGFTACPPAAAPSAWSAFRHS
jgi:hypothetical protein